MSWLRMINIYVGEGGGKRKEGGYALNKNNIGMHFTSKIHKNNINFLDLTITLHDDGSVHTKVFRKQTSTNNFLQWESHHPPPFKTGYTNRPVPADEAKLF